MVCILKIIWRLVDGRVEEEFLVFQHRGIEEQSCAEIWE